MNVDPTLDVEKAFLKYLGCSQDEAKKVHDLYYEVELRWQNYVAMLREKYNGSLGQLVGKNESDYDERANEFKEAFSKLETLVKGYIDDKSGSLTNNSESKNY